MAQLPNRITSIELASQANKPRPKNEPCTTESDFMTIADESNIFDAFQSPVYNSFNEYSRM